MEHVSVWKDMFVVIAVVLLVLVRGVKTCQSAFCD